VSAEVANPLWGRAEKTLTCFQGDIVSVEIPGLSLLILNTYDAAQELLAKRANTTSGRKIGYMIRKV